MAISETARLERESEETRAQLEHTLDELRARMSPGQLLDQATGYLRNSSGRAFLGNLRDEVVRNPLPIALVGAGIAWIAISGAVGRRRTGGDHLDSARDWGETGATAHDLAGHGGDPSTAGRARQAAEGLVDNARDAANEAGESKRERLGTAYDETIGRARDTAGAWVDEARSAASEAGDSLSNGARRVASKAADYGRAARHAIEPNSTLMNFCREQPMLVAGLGIAIGAAIGAMLPASRVETRIMGEASQKVRQRVSDVAAETVQSVAESGKDSGQNDGSSRKSAEPRDDEHRTYGDTSPSGAWSTGDSVDEVERGVRQGSRLPNTESEPQSAAPYAEAASSADFGKERHEAAQLIDGKH
jgi:ElaB/YqjD/DUF883 family membrane-anchored ribosome-binding protein